MSFTLDVLRSLVLPDFPSGSAITYFNEKVYLIGDDARNLLILDKDYNKMDSILLFEYPHLRVIKSEKADFETSTVVNMDGKDYLIVLGSASRKNRRKGLLIDLEKTALTPVEERFTKVDYTTFIKRLMKYGIEEVNLEGSAVIGDYFVLSSRANDKNVNNSFIVTDKNFWNDQEDAFISIIKLSLPGDSNLILGVSELCYVKEIDLLLITLSNEQTTNAYDDGEIGDSYVGWIESMQTKLNQTSLSLNDMVKLSNYDKIFIGQKIEGIFVESIAQRTLTIHLVSDNDQGESKLFKIRMTL